MGTVAKPIGRVTYWQSDALLQVIKLSIEHTYTYLNTYRSRTQHRKTNSSSLAQHRATSEYFKVSCRLSRDYRLLRSGSAVFPIQKTTFDVYFWRLPKKSFPAPASVYKFLHKQWYLKDFRAARGLFIKKTIENETKNGSLVTTVFALSDSGVDNRQPWRLLLVVVDNRLPVL